MSLWNRMVVCWYCEVGLRLLYVLTILVVCRSVALGSCLRSRSARDGVTWCFLFWYFPDSPSVSSQRVLVLDMIMVLDRCWWLLPDFRFHRLGVVVIPFVQCLSWVILCSCASFATTFSECITYSWMHGETMSVQGCWYCNSAAEGVVALSAVALRCSIVTGRHEPCLLCRHFISKDFTIYTFRHAIGRGAMWWWGSTVNCPVFTHRCADWSTRRKRLRGVFASERCCCMSGVEYLRDESAVCECWVSVRVFCA